MSIIRYQKGNSFWMATSPQANYPKLQADLAIDVAIVGGGIAGLTCAYLLKKEGLSVAVFEEKVIGGGTTGYTTGKVTSQHNLIYSRLYGRFGKDTARLYGAANQTAVEEVRRIVHEERIVCDWRDEDNYVFTEKGDQVAQLKHEYEVAESLGLPATFENETPLPFPVRGAVRFAGQGTFHARKYVLGLARRIHGDGGYVFENTKAGHIRDGEPVTIRMEGKTVSAKHAIIATLVPYPVSAHTAYGLVEYPLTSYIVATRSGHQFGGMYITPGGPLVSVLPVEADGERLILVGGEGHIPGTGRAGKHYRNLIEYARTKLSAEPTRYQWQAWDYLPYDRLPVIGKLYPWSRRVYVSSGFMKWGLSNSMVSAMILRDRITGKDNPWAAVFDSTRSSTISSIPRFLGELPKIVG